MTQAVVCLFFSSHARSALAVYWEMMYPAEYAWVEANVSGFWQEVDALLQEVLRAHTTTDSHG